MTPEQRLIDDLRLLRRMLLARSQDGGDAVARGDYAFVDAVISRYMGAVEQGEAKTCPPATTA